MHDIRISLAWAAPHSVIILSVGQQLFAQARPVFHRGVDGLAKGHAVFVTGKEQAALFVQQHDAAHGVIGHFEHQQIPAFQGDSIAVLHDLHFIVPGEVDALEAGEGLGGQGHGFRRHIHQIEIPVVGGVIKVVVGVDDARHVVADQVFAVFPDVARAVAAVDQDGVAVLTLQQVRKIAVRQDTPGLGRDFQQPVIGLAHGRAVALLIFQQNIAFAGKVKPFFLAHALVLFQLLFSGGNLSLDAKEWFPPDPLPRKQYKGGYYFKNLSYRVTEYLCSALAPGSRKYSDWAEFPPAAGAACRHRWHRDTGRRNGSRAWDQREK